MSDTQSQVLALITESLRRRKLDGEEPVDIYAAPDPDAAEKWLARTELEYQLMQDLIDDDENQGLDAIAKLVGFATTALEIWAMRSGHDPAALLQQIAIKRATKEDK